MVPHDQNVPNVQEEKTSNERQQHSGLSNKFISNIGKQNKLTFLILTRKILNII